VQSRVTAVGIGGTVSRLPGGFHPGSPEQARLPIVFRLQWIGFRFPTSKGFLDKTACAMRTADATCPFDRRITIVVIARVRCRREMLFLREELFAEWLPGGASVRQNYQEGPPPRLTF
jgi:hypothetical protein